MDSPRDCDYCRLTLLYKTRGKGNVNIMVTIIIGAMKRFPKANKDRVQVTAMLSFLDFRKSFDNFSSKILP